MQILKDLMRKAATGTSDPRVDVDAETDRLSGSHDDADDDDDDDEVNSQDSSNSDDDPLPDDFFGIVDAPDHDGSSSES